MVRACWQGAVLVGLVWLLLRLLKGVPSSTRSWIWLIAASKFVLVLLFVVELPVLDPLAVSRARSETGVETLITYSGSAAPALVFDWGLLLFGLWALGVLCVLWRGVRDHLELRSLVRGATPSCCDVPVSLRGVPILEHSEVAVPLVFGLFRPVVLLPEGINTQLSGPEMEMVLNHEGAHVARRDALGSLFFFLCQALFFFHPAVWLAKREWQIEREGACDAVAMSLARASAHDYAAMLLKVSTSADRAPAMALSAVPAYRTLQRRINAMKRPNESKRAGKALWPILALLISASAMPFALAQRKPHFGAGVFETKAPDVKVTAQRKNGGVAVGQPMVPLKATDVGPVTTQGGVAIAGPLPPTAVTVPGTPAPDMPVATTMVPQKSYGTATIAAPGNTQVAPGGTARTSYAPTAVSGGARTTIASPEPQLARPTGAPTTAEQPLMPGVTAPEDASSLVTVVLRDKQATNGKGLDALVSLDLEDVDLNSFMKFLGSVTKTKIKTQGVRSGMRLNARIENVSLGEVLGTLAKIYGLQWRLADDGSIVVSPFRG